MRQLRHRVTQHYFTLYDLVRHQSTFFGRLDVYWVVYKLSAKIHGWDVPQAAILNVTSRQFSAPFPTYRHQSNSKRSYPILHLIGLRKEQLLKQYASKLMRHPGQTYLNWLPFALKTTATWHDCNIDNAPGQFVPHYHTLCTHQWP